MQRAATVQGHAELTRPARLCCATGLLPTSPSLRAAAEPRSAQRAWLLDCVRQLWGGFRTQFLVLWQEHSHKGDAYHAQLFGSNGDKEVGACSAALRMLCCCAGVLRGPPCRCQARRAAGRRGCALLARAPDAR